MFQKLRTSRPAPVRSTSESAISPQTSTFWNRFRRPLRPPVRLPSFKSRFGSAFEDCKAGARPKRSPALIERRNATPSTRASRCTSVRRGKSAGINASSDSRASISTTIAAAPPRNDNTTLSVSSCRISRAREAPSAWRIASSRSRPEERASSRLAIFTQAINSTNPTAASSTTSVGRTLLVKFSCTGSNRTDQRDAAGYSFG